MILRHTDPRYVECAEAALTAFAAKLGGREAVRYGCCVPVAAVMVASFPELTAWFGSVLDDDGDTGPHVWMTTPDGRMVDPVGWQWEFPPVAYHAEKRAELADMLTFVASQFPEIKATVSSFIGEDQP